MTHFQLNKIILRNTFMQHNLIALCYSNRKPQFDNYTVKAKSKDMFTTFHSLYNITHNGINISVPANC